MATIGFIGLGTMGRPMARNLLKAGHTLVFYARRAEVVDEFVSLGARRAASPAEVMQQAEITMTIVTADPQLEEIVLAPHGLLAGASKGKLLVDMSTVSPATEHKLAERFQAVGVSMIDAPVSGGPWGAEAGTLSIMVGGDAADVERTRPILEVMGKHIFHVGPLGAGQTVKLVNQLVAGGIMALIGEGFVLAKAAGVDLNALADVMAVSSGNSVMLETRGKKFLLAGQYAPGFMTDLMLKDVSLAVGMAGQLGVPTPLAMQAVEQYRETVRLGHGRDDFAAVAKVCERAAGVQLKDG